MTFFGLLGHLAGLVVPALVVALLLCLALRLGKAGRAGRWPLKRAFPMLFGAGAAVLLAGLVVYGRDAKMLTYAALVLVQGSLGWWMQRR